MQLKKWFITTAPLTSYSLLILRVLMGILFIYHGHELFSKTAMQEFADWLEKDLHFPQPLFMAYLRTGAELFGGIMLVLGCCTRLGAFLIMITMLVAGFTAGNGDLFGDGETVFVYAAIMLTLILSGPNRLSIDYYLSIKPKKVF